MNPVDRSPPPNTWERALRLRRRIERPLERFLAIEAASGLVLVFSAALALLWANSRFAHAYHDLFETPVGVVVGTLTLRESLHFVVNELLMTIFFFAVGLEIRREIHHGELSRIKSAILPVAAAVGGMIAPALIYASLNRTDPTRHGWGIPMATDIAFAVGVLAIIGHRVPAALRVLLLALAIIDDVGAILVIAAFYSGDIAPSGLALAGVGMLLVFLLQRLGVRRPAAYVPAGAIVWLGLYAAHVHPTLAGVLLGLATPATAWFGPEGFSSVAHEVASEADHLSRDDPKAEDKMVPLLVQLRTAREEAVAPATRLQTKLHPWVAFLIMPLFALANAGISIGGHGQGVGTLDADAIRVLGGVALGLVVGKPIGIVAASLLATRLGLATLPRSVDAKGLAVVGTVAGIGFTMAIFIASLAFPPAHAALLDVAKGGILLASVTAAVLGLTAGVILLPKVPQAPEVTVDDAEGSDVD